MKIINFLLVVSILAVSLANEYGNEDEENKLTCSCGWTNTNKKRLTGGKETERNAYPWMVSLQGKIKKLHLCGGSIITKWHVLTAAHCTIGRRASRVIICVGAHNTKTCGIDVNSKYYKVHKIRKHRQNTRTNKVYDISILTTKDEIIFGLYIGPACFPNVIITEQLEAETLRVTGWGDPGLGTDLDILQELEVQVVPNLECEKDHPMVMKSPQICTQNPTGNMCKGDSGGPLVWLDTAIDRFTLLGLVSYGAPDCKKPDSPTVSTNVSAFYEWILLNIKRSRYPIGKTNREGVLCMKKN